MTKRPARKRIPAPGLERIVFFSDAVMAIAITLLVLEVRLPAEGTGGFGSRILALWPKYLGYVVSFWVIALYWVAHHRCFRHIRRHDRALVFLNFLFLMFIAFMPFPTGLLFSNSTEAASVVLYAGVAAGMGASLALTWMHAVRRGLVTSGLSRPLVRDILWNLVLPPFVFLLTIGLAFLDTRIAVYGWLLLVPVYLVRRFRGRSLEE
jgi:uncharacterized membrane protein